MIHSVIHFEHPGLADDAATLERNVNGLAGYNCANWMSRSVESIEGATVRGMPVPEDWGWALVVDVGKDAFVLGCSSDPDNEGGWQVLIGDNAIRGILPATRRRRTATLNALTRQIDTFLRNQAEVSNVKIETD